MDGADKYSYDGYVPGSVQPTHTGDKFIEMVMPPSVKTYMREG